MPTEQQSWTILRRNRVLERRGDSRSNLYLQMSQRLWTKPVRIGPRAVGWPLHEVDALIAARVAGRSDDEIRKLVAELEEARLTEKGPP